MKSWTSLRDYYPASSSGLQPLASWEETEALRLTVHKERCAAGSRVGQEQNRPQTSLSPVPAETLVETEGAWTPEPGDSTCVLLEAPEIVVILFYSDG